MVLGGAGNVALNKLCWKPDVSFDQLVETMVRADMDRVRQRR